MKKLTVILLMLVGLSGFAQQHEGSNHQKGQKMTSEEKAQVMTDRMTKQLDLTAQQQEKVKVLFLERAQKQQDMRADRKDKMKEVKGKMKDRRSKMREEMMAERKENMNELKAILSNEQFSKFQHMQNDRKEKMGQHRDGRNS